MSVITADTMRVDLLWETRLPQLLDVTVPIEDLEPDEVVPSTLPELMSWAYVRLCKSSDPRRSYRLLYSPSICRLHPDDQEVLIRFQGYVLGCDLRPLGTWHGTKQDAIKARQHLTIVAKDYPDIMHAQTETVRQIFQLVRHTLGFRSTFNPPTRKVVFQHVVFTKQRPHSVLPDLLTPQDDPSGRASLLAGEWVVAKKVDTQQMHQDGTCTPYPGALFQKGDFVDVVASVDIVTGRDDNGKTVRIYLDMQTVTLLQGSEQCRMADEMNRNTCNDDDSNESGEIGETDGSVE